MVSGSIPCLSDHPIVHLCIKDDADAANPKFEPSFCAACRKCQFGADHAAAYLSLHITLVLFIDASVYFVIC